MANLANEIKSQIIAAGWTITAVLNEMGMRGYKISPSVFSQKMRNGTLKHEEALMIADIIGKELKWVDKEEKQHGPVNQPKYHRGQ